MHRGGVEGREDVVTVTGLERVGDAAVVDDVAVELGLGVECGLSPDYLNLLRYGRSIMQRSETASGRGFHAGEAAVLVHKNGGLVEWTKTSSEEFGHGARIALYARDRQFTLSIEAIAQLEIQPEHKLHQSFITSSETAAPRRGGTNARGPRSDSSYLKP